MTAPETVAISELLAKPIRNDMDNNDTKRLKTLKTLLGYFQDGSDTMVTIYPDDATRTFHITAGNQKWWGHSLNEVLDKAGEDLANAEPSHPTESR